MSSTGPLFFPLGRWLCAPSVPRDLIPCLRVALTRGCAMLCIITQDLIYLPVLFNHLHLLKCFKLYLTKQNIHTGLHSK